MSLRALFGGAVQGITTYATFDPATKGTDITLSGGNLTMSDASADYANSNVYDDILITSGNRQVEFTLTTVFAPMIGIATVNTQQASYFASVATGYAYYPYGGTKYNNGSSTAYTTADTSLNGKIVDVRYNHSTGELEFYKGGVSQGVAFTLAPNTDVYIALLAPDSSTVTVNFGETAFTYPIAGCIGVGI